MPEKIVISEQNDFSLKKKNLTALIYGENYYEEINDAFCTFSYFLIVLLAITKPFLSILVDLMVRHRDKRVFTFSFLSCGKRLFVVVTSFTPFYLKIWEPEQLVCFVSFSIMSRDEERAKYQVQLHWHRLLC